MTKDKSPKHGKRMPTGNGWRLLLRDKIYAGTLITTLNVGKARIAIFSVPKRHYK